jgi:hypothetical protein
MVLVFTGTELNRAFEIFSGQARGAAQICASVENV